MTDSAYNFSTTDYTGILKDLGETGFAQQIIDIANEDRVEEVPPILYEDGTPQDGRGRIIGAKRGGEKYIPVYVYIREEDPELCRITNGLKSNLTHTFLS